MVDIASTYVGQTSITTLGTIATGTWQGTAIGLDYGGTGFSTYATGDLIYASATNTLSSYQHYGRICVDHGEWCTCMGRSCRWQFTFQTGNSGKYLTTDGTSTSWGVLTGWALNGQVTGGIKIIGSTDNYG